MYLERLHLKQVKLIHELELSFVNNEDFTDEHGHQHSAGEPRMWTVLIGKNGRGKSAILQSIALCACGSGTVNTFEAAPYFFPKNREVDECSLEADFRLGPPLSLGMHGNSLRPIPKERKIPSLGGELHKLTLSSVVKLSPHSSLFDSSSSLRGESLDPSEPSLDILKIARSENLPRWFVAGYGVARNLNLTSNSPKFSHVSTERLEPLFNQTKTLTGLGFADYFQSAEKTKFNRMLNSVIQATAELFPEIKELNLRGRGSVRTADDFLNKEKVKIALPSGGEMDLPATFLSHGYQSSLAWVADMIGHFLLDDPSLREAAHLSGLVLIDELDLHLHPTWQATFISALRKTFPRVQFVATTHSPLVLSSLRPEEIVVLELNEQGTITARTGDDVRDPRFRTVGELAAEFFEIDKLYPQPLGAKLKEYSVIAADRYRTTEDLQRAAQLKAELINQGITPSELLEPTPRRIRSMDELPDED